MDDFTSFCRFLCFFFFFLFPKSKKGADIKMAQEEEEGSCVVGGLFDDQGSSKIFLLSFLSFVFLFLIVFLTHYCGLVFRLLC